MLGIRKRSGKTNETEQLEHIKQWEKSGLTQAEYCRKNHINQHQLSYWLKRHESKAEEFYEVTTSHSNHSTGIELIISEHLKIHLNKNFDLTSLKRIIALVGEL